MADRTVEKQDGEEYYTNEQSEKNQHYRDTPTGRHADRSRDKLGMTDRTIEKQEGGKCDKESTDNQRKGHKYTQTERQQQMRMDRWTKTV